jgi:outer membrane protein assembly factor BamD
MRRLAVILAAVLAFRCGHAKPDLATLSSNSDQVIWEAGQKASEKRNWESARQHYKRIIEGFPQSELGPAARLALADSYFQEGGTANYILAVSQYRDFLTLYPSHPRSDYAQFQVGESFFKQKNGPDRDQMPTQRALDEYQRLVEIYPNSQQLDAAKGRIKECRQSLGEAEFRVGVFYQKTRQAYRSAIGRFEGVVEKYPDFDRFDEVLYRLGECLTLSGRAAEALPHLQRLLDKYPQSPFVESARKLMADKEKAGNAPAPPPPTPAATTPTAPTPPPAPR